MDVQKYRKKEAENETRPSWDGLSFLADAIVVGLIWIAADHELAKQDERHDGHYEKRYDEKNLIDTGCRLLPLVVDVVDGLALDGIAFQEFRWFLDELEDFV